MYIARWLLATLTIGLTLFAQAPSNDEPETAIILASGDSGTVIEGTTVGATDQLRDTNTNGVGSVWFKWTPNFTGHIEYVTELGAPGIWIWTPVVEAPGSPLGNNAREANKHFYVFAGVTYYFSIYTPPGQPGPFRFRIERIMSGPANDHFQNAIAIGSDTSPTVVRGTTVAATREPDEPHNAGGSASVWYKWTPSTSGRAFIRNFRAQNAISFFRGDANSPQELTQIGTDLERPIVRAGTEYYVAVYMVPRRAQEFWFELSTTSYSLPNDNFAEAIEVSPVDGWLTFTGTTLGSAYEPQEPVQPSTLGSVWFKWTVTQPTRIGYFQRLEGGGSWRFFTGASLSTLALHSGTMFQPGTYYVQVFDSSWVHSLQGPFSFRAPIEWTGLSNDSFAGAITVSSDGVLTVPVWDGGEEPGEPRPCHSFGPTFWWRYVAPASGVLLSHPEVLNRTPTHAVYRGTALHNLQLVSCPTGPGMALPVTEGEVLYFQVRQPTRLELAQPITNDNWANATQVGGEAVTIFSHNHGATREADEPPIGEWGGGSSVWFAWTAPYEGHVGISSHLVSGTFSIYRGAGLGSLELLPYGRRAVNEGDVLYLRVDSNPGATGPFHLSISAAPATAPNDHFANALELSLLNYDTHILHAEMKYATSEPNEPAHIDGPQKTAWWKWRPNFTGEAEIRFSMQGTAFKGGAVYTGSSLGNLQLVAKGEARFIAPVHAGMSYYIAGATPLDVNETLLVAAIARPSVIPPHPLNLVENGEFDQGTTGWVTSGSVETGRQFEASWTRLPSAAGIRQAITVEAGKTYRLQFKHGSDWSTNGALAVSWNEGQLASLSTPPASTMQWGSFTLTPQTSVITLRFDGMSGLTTLDSVSLMEVQPPPTIVVSTIADATVGLGGSFSFAVQAGGEGPFSYQWYKDGAALPGQIEAALSISNAASTHAGSYYVVVSNPSASSQSGSGVVTILEGAPQTIQFSPLFDLQADAAPITLSATASSGLEVVFRVTTGNASLNGNVLTIMGPGFVTVQASQSGNGQYAAAPEVNQSFTVHKRRQTITFPLLNVEGEQAQLLATSTSGLPVSFVVIGGPAVISGGLLVPTGAGPVMIAAFQHGNDEYEFAAPVQQEVVLRRLPQLVDFGPESQRFIALSAPGPIMAMALLQPQVELGAQASSALPVHFEIVSGPGSISGNLLTVEGAGEIRVSAVQPGDRLYLPASAERIFVSAGKATQTVDFAVIPPIRYGDAAVTLEANSSSGLPVSFEVVSGLASVTGNLLAATGAGPVVIRAFQSGSAQYEASPYVERAIIIGKKQQTLAFSAPEELFLGIAPITLAAQSSAGLPVQFELVDGPATLSGSELTIIGLGSVEVLASQPGDELHEAAASVARIIRVIGATQTISFPPLSDVMFGSAPILLQASSSAGLEIQFDLVSGDGSIAGNALTVTRAGLVTIRASQPGTEIVAAAAPVERTFTVIRASQEITLAPIPTVRFKGGSILLEGTSSSGLPVQFEALSGPATVQNNLLSPTGAGLLRVKATQAGSDNYAPAESEIEITIQKATQSITFPDLPSLVFGAEPVTLGAVASSDLPVLFEVVAGKAVVDGNALSFTGAGAVTIRALQVGDNNHEAAPPVERTAQIAKAAQTIIPPSPPPITNGETLTLSVTASSGLPVDGEVMAGPVTIEGLVLTAMGAGSARVRLSQNGNDDYLAAPEIEVEFTIAKAAQEIIGPTLPALRFGNAPVPFSATSSSGLPVSAAVLAGPATIVEGKLAINGAGEVRLELTQPGDDNFLAAMLVTNLTVLKAEQTVTFALPATIRVDRSPLQLTATSSSGLPVQFSVLSGNASVTNDLLYLQSAGEVLIEASQAGNGDYEPAALTRTLMISPLPEVKLMATASELKLTWPSADSDFVLEEAPAISGPWTPVGITGEAEGNTVTIETSGQQRFFRLRKTSN